MRQLRCARVDCIHCFERLVGQAHRHHSGQYSGAEFSDKTHGLVVANVPFRHLDSAIGEPCIATGVCFDGPALCMLGRVAELADGFETLGRGFVRTYGSRIWPIGVLLWPGCAFFGLFGVWTSFS